VEKILPLAGFFWVWGLDAGEDSFKEENKSKEKFGQFFAANFAAYSHYIVTQKLRRKLRRQNFASTNSPTNKYVALVGTYTNMHVHRYELGNN